MKMAFLRVSMLGSALLSMSLFPQTGRAAPSNEEARLILYQGESEEEAPPATVNFRFELTLYVQPLADGTVEFIASPYVPPQDAGRNDCVLSGDIVRVEDEKTVASIFASEAGTKIIADFQAGKLYRIKLASLVNGNPGDKSAKFRIPENVAAAIPASLAEPAWIEGVAGFLWIPANCSELFCIGSPRLSLFSPEGTRSDIGTAKATEENAKKVPVRPDQTGQIWKVGPQTRGRVGIGGAAPAWINLNRQHLLLPPGVR